MAGLNDAFIQFSIFVAILAAVVAPAFTGCVGCSLKKKIRDRHDAKLLRASVGRD